MFTTITVSTFFLSCILGRNHNTAQLVQKTTEKGIPFPTVPHIMDPAGQKSGFEMDKSEPQKTQQLPHCTEPSVSGVDGMCAISPLSGCNNQIAAFLLSSVRENYNVAPHMQQQPQNDPHSMWDLINMVTADLLPSEDNAGLARQIQQVPPSYLDNFHKFPKLPFEIRARIWKHACDHPRIIKLHLQGSRRGLGPSAIDFLPSNYNFGLQPSYDMWELSRSFTAHPVLFSVSSEAAGVAHQVYTFNQFRGRVGGFYANAIVDTIAFVGSTESVSELESVGPTLRSLALGKTDFMVQWDRIHRFFPQLERLIVTVHGTKRMERLSETYEEFCRKMKECKDIFDKDRGGRSLPEFIVSYSNEEFYKLYT